MNFGDVPTTQAEGHILAHKLFKPDGSKLFSKGRRLSAEDVHLIQTLGIASVTVAALNSTDLDEDTAARRVGEALAGPGIKVTAPGVGRANLTAEAEGPLCIDVRALERINNIDEGITVATLREHSLVQPRKLVALVKIIPYGISADRVADVEAIAAGAAPLMWVRPLQPRSVGLIIAGPSHGEAALIEDFAAPTRTRLERLGSSLAQVRYVPHAIEPIAEAVQAECATHRDLILMAGVSAIMDREDVMPSALRKAGGSVAHFGAPVDPGSLLMLGYLGQVPVLGLPGCIKSLKFNIIDLILPRLLAGERLTRADLVAMGHGGLLEDISGRPMPRSSETSDD